MNTKKLSFIGSDPERELDIPIPRTFAPRENDGGLRSRLSELSMLLTGYLEARSDDSKVERLALELMEETSHPERMTTQERARVLIALGRYFHEARQKYGDVSAEIYADGKKIGDFNSNSKDGGTLRITKGILGKKIRVVSSGKGRLWYSWRSSGSRRDWKNAPRRDRGLRVERRYLLEDGREAGGAPLSRGAVVVVELTINAESALDNVVVLDMLPAGLEMENPRLATRMPFDPGKGPRFLKPDHVERRDDRLALFGSVPQGKSIYRYVVRAVTSGKFASPAVYAECMYDPAVHSVGKSGEVVVK